jgi:hypothetical protein
MLKKILLLILFFICSCGQVTVYDKIVCGDLGEDGAHCNHTLKQEPADYDKATWDSMRIGWMCVDPTGFNDTETALDQLCTTTNRCTYKQRQAIEEVKARIREIGIIANEAKNKANK